MSARSFLKRFLLLSLFLAAFTVLLSFSQKARAVPLIFLEQTAVRQSYLPQGTAGMMAEYIPESGNIYLLGGYRNDGEDKVLTDEVWRYDPVLDELAMIGELPGGLALAAHTYVPEEGLIYLFGGVVENGATLTTSSAIRTFNVMTGEVTTLSATLPAARARASAVYTANGIFIFGGVAGGNVFSSSFDEGLHYSLSTNQIVDTISLPDWGSINDDNYWTSAHYLIEPYPYEPDPKEVEFSDPPDGKNYILVLGTHGYLHFDPTTAAIVDETLTETFAGNVGAATAYVPTRRHVWSAAGYGLQGSTTNGFLCVEAGIDTLDPRMASIDPLSEIPFTSDDPDILTNTQNDGAAVYVPDLDRVLVFGGFMSIEVITGQLCSVPWSNNPEPGQYSDVIYSISPEYYDEYDWTADDDDDTELTIFEVTNLVAGQTTTLSLYAPVDEEFAIAMQGPYRSSNGSDRLLTRVLPGDVDDSDPDFPKVTVEVPPDITPHEGQRVVALCAISLDRDLPPNCRETLVTLQPGSLSGTVTRDLSGAGLSGTEPVAGATVELRDIDNALIDTTTTNASGEYAFCSPGSHCLALGEYTINVWRDYEEGDDFIDLPTSVSTTIKANQTTITDIELETSEIMGPAIRRLAPEHDGLAGDSVGTFFSFDHLSGVDAPEVWNTFVVYTQDFIPQRPASKVEFELNGEVVVDEDDSPGYWVARFDMSEVLTSGRNYLNVTAYDDQGLAGETRQFNILAIPAKPITASWIVSSEGVQWNAFEQSYTTRILIPNNPKLRWPDDPPQVLDLEIIQFYNQFRADLEIVETYSIDGFWEAQGDGAVLAQIMATDPDEFQLEERLEVQPQYVEIGGGAGGDEIVGRYIQSYKVSRRFDLCRLNLPKCGEWIPTPAGIGVEEEIWGIDLGFRIGIDMKYEASVRVSGFFDGDDWSLDRVRVTPRPSVSARGAIILSVDFFVASGEAGAALIGDVIYDQPIVIDPDESPPVSLEDPCIQFLVSLRLWAGYDTIFGGDEIEYTKELLDERLPGGCTPEELRLAATLLDFELPDVMPGPAVAVAGGGSVMSVWVEDVDPGADNIDLALKYAFDSVSGGDENGTITDALGVYDPAVAFLDDDTAVAVWSQINSGAQSGQELADVLPGQELYASFWNQGSGWSTPERLTNNSVSDGRAVIATHTVGDTDLAMVAWVRDSDGNASTRGDWQMVARHWDGSEWDAEMVVTNEPGQADLEPAIAYSDSGLVWLVWVRDGDADFTTHDDRRLAYATWDAVFGWSTVEQPSSWPEGALHPTLAFSPLSTRPLVAMVVPPDEASTGAAEAALTPEMRLYAAWWGPSASDWDVQAIGDTRGTWPQATIYTDNHAMIVLRGFGGGDADGPASTGGQIIVAAGELKSDSARWADPGTLTSDEDVIWQVGGIALPIPDETGHPVPNGKMSFVAVRDTLPPASQARAAATSVWTQGAAAPVEMVGDRQARMLGGNGSTGVFEVGDPMEGIDPYIEDVELSNPWPEPGEIVTVTVTLRNEELRPMGSTGNTNLLVRLTCQQDVCPGTLDSQSYNGEMLFNEQLTFDLTYRSTGEVEQLRAVVENHPNDLDNSNNEYLFLVGREVLPPPRAVEAAYTAEDQIDVGWLPPENEEGMDVNDTGYPYHYFVYRSLSEEGPWTLVGESSSTRFFDRVMAGDTTLYYYAVRAYDVRGRFSPLSIAAQTTEMGESGPPTVYLPFVVRP